MEVTLYSNWFNHIVQLAQQVNEVDCFVAEVLKPLCLLFIEVLHLVRSYNLIVVQIDYFKPVVECLGCGFILLAKHEVHEVLIAHFAFNFGPKFTWNLIENSVNCLS